MVELSRCTQEMLAARNPLGIAACYGNFCFGRGSELPNNPPRSGGSWFAPVSTPPEN